MQSCSRVQIKLCAMVSIQTLNTWLRYPVCVAVPLYTWNTSYSNAPRRLHLLLPMKIQFRCRVSLVILESYCAEDWSFYDSVPTRGELPSVTVKSCQVQSEYRGTPSQEATFGPRSSASSQQEPAEQASSSLVRPTASWGWPS